MNQDLSYEDRLGRWLADRCKKRAKAGPAYAMPDYVKYWLDHGGKSPADADTNPTVRVAGWLMETTTNPTWDPIDDPDWPRP